jgi:hypothetical protein
VASVLLGNIAILTFRLPSLIIIEIMVPSINNSQNILVGKAVTVKNEIEMMDHLT